MRTWATSLFFLLFQSLGARAFVSLRITSLAACGVAGSFSRNINVLAEKVSSASIANDEKDSVADSFKKQEKPVSNLVHKVVERAKSVPNAWVSAGLALVAGYRWGVQAVDRKLSVLAAGESAAAEVVRSRPPYLLNGILITLIAREIWRTIPVWLKRQIPLVRGRYATTTVKKVEVDDTDITAVGTLARKLQTLLAATNDRLDSTSALYGGELGSSLLALLQLTAQLKQQRADHRDMRYEQEGVPADKEMLRGLDEALELADLAYAELPDGDTLKDALARMEFSLVRHDKVTLPGYVAHYIAIHKTRKVAVIAVKGTSAFEDFLTDACGSAVPLTLDEPFVEGGGTELTCHEGVLLAAKRLAGDVEAVIEELLLPSGYTLLLTGHSLGAGVAALLGLLLRSRFPSLRVNDDKGAPRLQVLAFASPPIVDHDSSLACASFVTTIVNNSDIIPRASLSNVLIMMEILKILKQKLIDKGMDPASWKTTASFIKSFIASESQAEMIMTVDEVNQGLEVVFEKVELRDPAHLYVPGRVFQMFDLWSKPDYGLKRVIEQAVVPEWPPLDSLLHPAKKVHLTDGASKVLRAIEIDARMLSDHSSASYRSSIRALLSNEASE